MTKKRKAYPLRQFTADVAAGLKDHPEFFDVLPMQKPGYPIPPLAEIWFRVRDPENRAGNLSLELVHTAYLTPLVVVRFLSPEALRDGLDRVMRLLFAWELESTPGANPDRGSRTAPG